MSKHSPRGGPALPKPREGFKRLHKEKVDQRTFVTVDQTTEGSPNSRVRVQQHYRYVDRWDTRTLYVCGNPIKAANFLRGEGKSLKDRTRGRV